MNEKIDNFLNHVREAGTASRNTVINYESVLRRFFSRYQQLNKNTLELFIRSLREQNKKGATINTYISYLNAYAKYYFPDLVVSKEIHRNRIKLQSRKLNILSMAQFNAMREAAKNDTERAMLEVLFSTGMRVSELTSLKWEEVPQEIASTDAIKSLSIIGKGSKQRVVFLSREASSWLNLVRSTAGYNRPFPYTPRGIQQMIKRIARDAKVTTRVTPHSLRHLFATNLLSNGADIRLIQKFLGHSSILTTQIYTHVSDPMLQEAFSRFHNPKVVV